MSFKKFADVKTMSREEWLQSRRNGIGGSEIAAICGISKYDDAYSIYLKKVEPEKIPDRDNSAMSWGRELEPLVSKAFSKETGLKIQRCNFILQSEEMPYMLANVDRMIVGEKAGLEVKTAKSYSAHLWTEDSIPEMYELQIQHYMYVTGYEYWYVAVLIDTSEFKWYKINRNEAVIEHIKSFAKDFWENHVLKQIPPPAGNSTTTSDYINDSFKAEPNSEVDILDAEAPLEQYNYATEQAKYWEGKKDEAENQLKLLLDNHEIGFYKDYKISYKMQAGRRSFDREKFNTDYPGVYEVYQKVGKPSPKFTVSKKRK